MAQSFYIAKVGESYVSELIYHSFEFEYDYMTNCDVSSVGLNQIFAQAKILNSRECQILQHLFKNISIERYERDSNFGNGREF
ncbi:hypothetical protein EauS123_00026 [Exiguobacterium phage vB_EauS-123]|nr:hypothetical protein EauS123_00026 [Exiguobacterium phage vB_EauS-123]